MLTIYGSPKSSSGRCYWCLEEAGVNYAAKPVNFRDKEHKSDEYLKINPNGKVPALTDGEFVIWESMAINFYIAEAYKPEFLGHNVQQRGLVYQWSIWAIADLQPPIIETFIQLVFVPEQKRNLEAIEKAKGKLPALLATLNQGLENRAFLLGEEFSLADLNVASVVTICSDINYDISNYENITSWLSKIYDRPAYQKYQNM